ncbi:hypothetical protein HYN56_23225 [Flavobacterium crocinum]|uniref:Uncharacterized protein n=1 Tax=Flavobacterium crocinum TaxID=2183896 RepID=A0A2S1YSI6_9FLAO|nr:hypothetical protein [Flavobacterium crocinum]AWK06983.1 hypothetical protein HYN56_23225 [Flavobacterium crocinum]
MTKEQFKKHLLQTIEGIVKGAEDKAVRFTVNPIKETNVTYNSTDDFIRLWMLNEKNIIGRFFTINEVSDFLSQPNYKFPLWIKVFLTESTAEKLIFELKISMRFRTPSQLKNVDTGHPPFVYEQ